MWPAPLRAVVLARDSSSASWLVNNERLFLQFVKGILVLQNHCYVGYPASVAQARFHHCIVVRFVRRRIGFTGQIGDALLK
ncbi:hypothetical protein KCP74_20175 [Salmonella enterica subsp. enterica]|nr:hypothetical protein KCP74_20175 [Salmonella enterica subsp. enterica]